MELQRDDAALSDIAPKNCARSRHARSHGKCGPCVHRGGRWRRTRDFRAPVRRATIPVVHGERKSAGLAEKLVKPGLRRFTRLPKRASRRLSGCEPQRITGHHGPVSGSSARVAMGPVAALDFLWRCHCRPSCAGLCLVLRCGRVCHGRRERACGRRPRRGTSTSAESSMDAPLCGLRGSHLRSSLPRER